MDYEFLRDITGVVKVRMSMGHEVVGHWFNEEVKENLALLDEVEQAAHALKGSERSWQRAGHEYTLWMDGEEVMVRANQLEFAGDEMEGEKEGRRRGGSGWVGVFCFCVVGGGPFPVGEEGEEQRGPPPPPPGRDAAGMARPAQNHSRFSPAAGSGSRPAVGGIFVLWWGGSGE